MFTRGEMSNIWTFDNRSPSALSPGVEKAFNARGLRDLQTRFLDLRRDKEDWAGLIKLARIRAAKVPEDADALFDQGSACRKLEKVTESEEALRKGMKMVALDERDRYREILTFVLAHLGRFKEALEMAERTALPTYPTAYVYAVAKDAKKATEAIRARSIPERRHALGSLRSSCYHRLMTKPIVEVNVESTDGKKGKARAVFDTGSHVTIIREDCVPAGAVVVPREEPRETKTAAQGGTHHITGSLGLAITIGDRTIEDLAMVSPDLSQQMLIGSGTMQKWDITIRNKDGHTHVEIPKDMNHPDIREVD